jgi:hypothetical protein
VDKGVEERWVPHMCDALWGSVSLLISCDLWHAAAWAACVKVSASNADPLPLPSLLKLQACVAVCINPPTHSRHWHWPESVCLMGLITPAVYTRDISDRASGTRSSLAALPTLSLRQSTPV